MKNLIKAVYLLLAASIVISQPALASQEVLPSSQGNAYQVIINNTCSRDIRVAVHYQHPDRGWITQGWWDRASDGYCLQPQPVLYAWSDCRKSSMATGKIQETVQ